MSSEKAKISINTSDSPQRPVDYYYLEAMRHLSCGDGDDPPSDDSDTEWGCQRSYADEDKSGADTANTTLSSNEECMGRERGWSHSLDEFGTIGQLPNVSGNKHNSRLNTRRYSDGMLLKCDMKMESNSHVQWADDCKQDLTRYRPRKKYVRNPTAQPPKVKSILKIKSDEHMQYHLDDDRLSSDDETSAEPPS